MKKIITFLLILPIILSSCFSKKTEEQSTSSGNISTWKIENNSRITQTWKTEKIKEISNSGNKEKTSTWKTDEIKENKVEIKKDEKIKNEIKNDNLTDEEKQVEAEIDNLLNGISNILEDSTKN